VHDKKGNAKEVCSCGIVLCNGVMVLFRDELCGGVMCRSSRYKEEFSGGDEG